MKLSIITVNLDNKEGLKRTIDSVVAQSSPDFELIVVDGNSKDGSKKILEQYAGKINKVMSEPDTGIYNAMNKGIKLASGEYLLFLNSGDWLQSDQTLKKVIPLLSNGDVVSGDIDIFDAGKWHHMSSQDKISVLYFLKISLYHQATFIRRDLFERYGLYDERFTIGGDYEFFIRTLLNKRATYVHLKEKISCFVADGISNDPKHYEKNMREKKMAWEMNFSTAMINEFNEYEKVFESKEYYYGKRFYSLLRKLGLKK